MPVHAFPLGQNIPRSRFSERRRQFAAAFPDNGAARTGAYEYARQRLKDTDLPLRSYLAYLSLWNDTPDQRRDVGNHIYHLRDITKQHKGQTIMVVTGGSLDSLNTAQSNLVAEPRRYAKIEPVSITLGRIQKVRGEKSSVLTSNIGFFTRVLNHTPHPRLPIPGPSLSFETSLVVTHDQRLQTDEFGKTEVLSGEPTEKAVPVLMLEGGAPLGPLDQVEDYQAGRQFVSHEFVIGDVESFALVSMLYQLHNRGDMSRFDGRGVTDYLAMPDMNRVFDYGES